MDAWTCGNTDNHTTGNGGHFSKSGERGILLVAVIGKLSKKLFSYGKTVSLFENTLATPA